MVTVLSFALQACGQLHFGDCYDLSNQKGPIAVHPVTSPMGLVAVLGDLATGRALAAQMAQSLSFERLFSGWGYRKD